MRRGRRPASAKDAPDARRVLLVTIDGLRPDLALLADAPAIRSLMRAGCYSMWARTTDIAITLPSHTTLVTGVSPKVHGVTWNADLKPDQHVYPNVPTIFELAKKAGMSTAIVAGKTKFDALARPGSVDWLWLPNGEPFDDLTVADEAGKIIRDHRPQVMLLHFPFVDTVGHAQGWGSPQQLAAIAQADRALARVLVSLDATGVRKNTLLILTADHGGCGKGHGGTKPLPRTDPASTAPAERVPDQASLHIPWIAAGGSVREGVDLTQYRELNVRIEDSFATACQFLGLPIPDNCEGKVVKELWEVPAPPAVRSSRDAAGVSLTPFAARLNSKTCIPVSLSCSCCSIEETLTFTR